MDKIHNDIFFTANVIETEAVVQMHRKTYRKTPVAESLF